MNGTPSTKDVRWGIVGTGVVSRDFADDLGLVPGARIAAVASRNPENARAFAASHPGCRAYGSVAELAADPELDVVYVASPNHLHREHGLTCLRAGRPLLCEKPFACTAGEALEVIGEARRRGLFCMEAMWMRFHPLVQKVREMIRSGEIGTIRLLTAEFGYQTPFAVGSRFFDPAQGGGALLDRGVYLLSLATFLLGPPTEVDGRASVGPSGVDEQEALILRHEAGTLAVLTASLRSRLRNEAIVVGTRGQVRLHDPFYAPRLVTTRRFQEPESPPHDAAQAASPAGGLKRRLRRNPFVRGLFQSVGRPLLNLVKPSERTLRHPVRGLGYEFEIAEVMDRLREGARESLIMPLDETVAILRMIDDLRKSWRISPAETDR